MYQIGDLVYTTHMGDVYKCVVTATNSNIYTVEPIEGRPGAFVADRHIDRLRHTRHERLTVDRRADEEAAYTWRNMEQIQHEARERSWPRPFIACPHCGGNEYEGNHEPINDYNFTGEETYHCQYPKEIDF